MTLKYQFLLVGHISEIQVFLSKSELSFSAFPQENNILDNI